MEHHYNPPVEGAVVSSIIDIPSECKIHTLSVDLDIPTHDGVRDVLHNMLQSNNIGLIFIRTEEPLSKVTMSITKQPWSHVGFYIPVTVTGRKKILIACMDLFDPRITSVHRKNISSRTPSCVGTSCTSIPAVMLRANTWYNPSYSIDDLISNPLVTRLGYKPLRPIMKNGSEDPEATKRCNSNMRSAIATVMSYGPETSIRERVCQLIGHPIENPTRGSTAIEMVNRVIMMAGKWSEVPQVQAGTNIIHPPARVEGTSCDEKIQVLLSIFSQVNQNVVPEPGVANLLIQAYLTDNALFGDMYEIPIEQHDQTLVSIIRANIYHQQKDLIREIASTFIDMILNDHLFFQTVMSGMSSCCSVVDIYKRILLDVCDSYSDIASGIIECSISQENKGEKIGELFNLMNSKRAGLGIMLGLDIPTLQTGHTSSMNTSSYNREALDELCTILAMLNNSIKQKQPYIVDIPRITELVNKLSPHDRIPPCEELCVSLPSHTAIKGDEEEKGSGKITSLYDTDVHSLSSLELHDLIKTLDSIHDTKLESLRAKVARRIAMLT